MTWAVFRRPRLWGEAARATLALAPRSWWARGRRLPVPDPAYLAWRRQTAYGSTASPMMPADVVAYLDWRRRFRRSTVRRGVGSG